MSLVVFVVVTFGAAALAIDTIYKEETRGGVDLGE